VHCYVCKVCRSDWASNAVVGLEKYPKAQCCSLHSPTVTGKFRGSGLSIEVAEHWTLSLRHCLDLVGCCSMGVKASIASFWINALTMATLSCGVWNLLTAELVFSLESVQGNSYRTCWIDSHRVNDFLAGEAVRGVTKFNRTNSEKTKQVSA